MKKLFPLILVSAFLSSCSASFGDGGFIIPLGCLIGALFFLKGFVKSRERYQLIFGLILAVAAVVFYLWMESSK